MNGGVNPLVRVGWVITGCRCAVEFKWICSDFYIQHMCHPYLEFSLDRVQILDYIHTGEEFECTITEMIPGNSSME